MRNLTFLLTLVAFASGCTGMMPRGTKIQVPHNGNRLFRSSLTMSNSAGNGVVIVPFTRGEGFVSEYTLEKRKWWCGWLCREKVPTKVFALTYGQQLTVPLLLNTTTYFTYLTVGFKVYQRNQLIGEYLTCVEIPAGQPVHCQRAFDRSHLAAVKRRGSAGATCQSNGWYWWNPHEYY
jgi:hypothetical protein